MRHLTKISKLNFSDKEKAIITNVCYVPTFLIIMEHLVVSFGVDVSSLSWQIVVTIGMFVLTHMVLRKYIKDEKKLLLHFIPNLAIVPSIFDRGSYILFYLRSGRVEPAGEWAKSVYPSTLARFLASSIYKNLPILFGDVIALSIYVTYLGFQIFDKKLKIMKTTKEKLLEIYSKVYDKIKSYCEKSSFHKYLIIGVLSFPLAASGAPLLVIYPIISVLILDGIEKIKK